MGVAIDAAEEYSPDPPRRGVRPMRLALACLALAALTAAWAALGLHLAGDVGCCGDAGVL